MASGQEIAAMRRALELARTPGVPHGPNPRVGAVLIDRSGGLVAEGFHRGVGTAHAEVDALTRAGERARGCTAVVTLEPCSHTGHTGPCAKALIDAGVSRVVFGQPDRSPVAAGGADALRAAGVAVEAEVLVREAEAVNPVWTFALRHGRPFVTWKFAATLDGRSAAADGSSKWITGPDARADVHRLRAECDAIAVGTGTIVSDDPRLTVRAGDGSPLPIERQPLRVVIGRRALPTDANVFDREAETAVLTTRDLPRALSDLFERGLHHVWLEGGPTLSGAFIRAGLVDEIVAYVAPALLGAGLAAVADLGIDSIGRALRYEFTDVRRVGVDVRLTMRGRR